MSLRVCAYYTAGAPSYALNASGNFCSIPIICKGSMAGAATNSRPLSLSKQPYWAGITISISHIHFA